MSEITVIKAVSVPVAFLQVNAGVRYWEDATLNGKSDNDGSVPFRVGDAWQPIIDLKAGTVVNWPRNIEADIHYKVCDAGIYRLLDTDGNEVVKIDGYVPSIMCPEGNGYGDYIIMKIGSNGQIENWKIDLEEFQQDQPNG